MVVDNVQVDDLFSGEMDKYFSDPSFTHAAVLKADEILELLEDDLRQNDANILELVASLKRSKDVFARNLRTQIQYFDELLAELGEGHPEFRKVSATLENAKRLLQHIILIDVSPTAMVEVEKILDRADLYFGDWKMTDRVVDALPTILHLLLNPELSDHEMITDLRQAVNTHRGELAQNLRGQLSLVEVRIKDSVAKRKSGNWLDMLIKDAANIEKFLKYLSEVEA